MPNIVRSIDPDANGLRRLAAMPAETPVTMLNLLRFHEQATYAPDTGAKPCSGCEAYARYSRVALEQLKVIGGEPVWVGAALDAFIAPPGERWDEMLLVRYPSIGAFLRMLAQPDYRAATFHRTAALEDARLIVTRTPDAG